MISRLRQLALATTIALLGGSVLLAQQEKGKAAPEAMTGPKVGEKAPSFTLKDQDGKDRSLDEFLAKGNVALVFTRSTDW